MRGMADGVWWMIGGAGEKNSRAMTTSLSGVKPKGGKSFQWRAASSGGGERVWSGEDDLKERTSRFAAADCLDGRGVD